MATITLHDDHVRIALGMGEKIAGLVGDREIPLSTIRTASVEPEPFRTLSGLRAPGLSVPGRTKIGTWRGHGRKVFVCLHGSVPAIRIETAPERGFDAYVVTVDDPGELAARLTEAVDRNRS